jgi:hypothetical protein
MSRTESNRPFRSTPTIPSLVSLHYGNPYCEECRDRLQPGQQVAWWRVYGGNGWRKAVLCAACHYDRVRVNARRRP